MEQLQENNQEGVSMRNLCYSAHCTDSIYALKLSNHPHRFQHSFARHVSSAVIEEAENELKNGWLNES